jgi:co-chaperonin GroES (HSP10)
MAEQTIQLPGRWAPDIDAEFASQFLSPKPGVVVVEQWPEPGESAGGVLIAGTEGSQWRLSPDAGTVLAAGPDVPLMPGDTVFFDHEHGKRISGFVAGDYETEREVRIFGRAAKTNGDTVIIPWEESILGEIDVDGNDLRDARLLPYGDWVLVRRDPLHDQSEGGILLSQGATSRPSKGVVVAKGTKARDVEIGERVIYQARTTTNLQSFKHVLCPAMQDDNLVLMKSASILCVVHLDGSA